MPVLIYMLINLLQNIAHSGSEEKEMAGRPRKRAGLKKDSFMMVRGFPVSLRLHIKSLAARDGETLRRWIIDACLMKIAKDRQDREQVRNRL